MSSHIVVHPSFYREWPLAAEKLYGIWDERGDPEFTELEYTDDRTITDVLADPSEVTQLASLGVSIDLDRIGAFTNLEEAALYTESMYSADEAVVSAFESEGVLVHDHDSEGYWGESVSECALGLTIAALRRIPHRHNRITESTEPWEYMPKGTPEAGGKGRQHGDRWSGVNGTIAGKSVRIVGAGNIGSRYADVATHLGADIQVYDPFAPDPSIHRTGGTRVFGIDELATGADIFAPMVPLTEETANLVTAEHIKQLPTGALVVLVTRAGVCDMEALRKRVRADELQLAADVWDVEPLPLDDPLLERDNVVHTPHIAGRTEHANRRWAEMLSRRFSRID